MELEGEFVGAGGYGLVISSNDSTEYAKLISLTSNDVDALCIKLIYDINACNSLVKEANVQKRAREILLSNKSIKVSIPKITDVLTKISKYKDKEYLCGIIMERVIPPAELWDMSQDSLDQMQVHIALGYKGSDINNIWYVNNDSKLYRGFYADAKMIEALGGDVDSIAYQMGLSLRTLIDNGIIPNDIEFVLDKNLKVWMIDFGLAEFGNIDPIKYLNKEGWDGLKNDVYVPHNGMRGYESFLSGYLIA